MLNLNRKYIKYNWITKNVETILIKNILFNNLSKLEIITEVGTKKVKFIK